MYFSVRGGDDREGRDSDGEGGEDGDDEGCELHFDRVCLNEVCLSRAGQWPDDAGFTPMDLFVEGPMGGVELLGLERSSNLQEVFFDCDGVVLVASVGSDGRCKIKSSESVPTSYLYLSNASHVLLFPTVELHAHK